ncbi:soluble inorganic pyrophosphatase-like [Tripterygium wilfordii]|uniref:Soluble inorganic pyrophosphatase-like n=1 Tax=Tripterygium wilfordii TaxID=458696 RepID=A0A7J7DX74_TRIWF|nr:soluble inorganic pyrophosphatase-like [Tripterygium wilfordii]
MTPPIETITKALATNQSHHPPLNERIISSMTRRSIAAHPWHDLEIGMQNHDSSCVIFLFLLIVSCVQLTVDLTFHICDNRFSNFLLLECRTWSSKGFQLCKNDDFDNILYSIIFLRIE